jgi:aldose 1-epimerase
MSITRSLFGTLGGGEKVYLYTLKAGDLTLTLSTLGAGWVSLYAPDARGRDGDIILGYSTLGGYTRNATYQGVTVGRFANRMSRAAFTLGGKTYHLHEGEGGNTLHGGRRGFDKRVWEAAAYTRPDGVCVRFELLSPDGDEGFPGALRAVVTYALTHDNEIHAEYRARVDAPSPVNLTNHAYFNLRGEGNGTVLGHEAAFHASAVVDIDGALIPTGRLTPVAGTPFDFTRRKPIGRDIEAAGGYDHCFVLDGEEGALKPAAEVYEEVSGRVLRLSTTQSGVQFYTGNFLDGVAGKLGSVYGKHGGFCLETQCLPDSPNRPEFPSAIFGPGRDYLERAVFSFGVR